MAKDPTFLHTTSGRGRPQIILIGNGLELCGAPTSPDPKGRKGQLTWSQLVESIKADNSIVITDNERESIPFPLLYSLLSTPYPAPAKLSKEAVSAEEERLKLALNKLSQASYPCLDLLKTIGADHIMTTNYNYGLEQSFFPGEDFMNSKTRSSHRFNLNSGTKNKKPIREIQYRMHSGYLANNADGSSVGLWHIHGECSVTKGVILSHDRYGRLLSRIEKICDSQDYNSLSQSHSPIPFYSWPELFLYGDVYIVGFSFDLSEFDLWWLLKRKQRERLGNGKVYFFEHANSKEKELKHKLLQAHGVEIPHISSSRGNYLDFYQKTLIDIKNRVQANKTHESL